MEHRLLTEIYRRINYFKKDLSDNCIICLLPSQAKEISKFGIITPSFKLYPRHDTWYKLTDKGKEIFSNYNNININEQLNLDLYHGRVSIDINLKD
jgi:hypothetical protein